ncbi:hypothetical protein Pfo_014000, partial [Paulownia fortunei]
MSLISSFFLIFSSFYFHSLFPPWPNIFDTTTVVAATDGDDWSEFSFFILLSFPLFFSPFFSFSVIFSLFFFKPLIFAFFFFFFPLSLAQHLRRRTTTADHDEKWGRSLDLHRVSQNESR